MPKYYTVIQTILIAPNIQIAYELYKLYKPYK